MRNYFDALELPRITANLEVRKVVDSLSPEQLADEGDMQSVLLNDQWRDQYKRVHLQYEAIAATINNPSLRALVDTHSWDERVVEFTPDQNTI